MEVTNRQPTMMTTAMTPLEKSFSFLWLFGIIAVFLPTTDIFNFQVNPINDQTLGGIDHQIFWFAGVETALGRVLEVYDSAVLRENMIERFSPKYKAATWFYPPHAMLIYAPLMASLPYGLSFLATTVASLVTFMFTIVKTFSSNSRVLLLAVLAPSTFMSIFIGQNGVFISSLIMAALFILPKRPILAGILIGCLTIKPQFGLLIPFILLFERRFLTFGVASLTTISSIGISVLWLGTDVWLLYLNGFYQGVSSSLLQHFVALPSNTLLISIYGFTAEFGASHELAMICQGLVAVACVVAAFFVSRSKIDPLSKAATYIALTYLMSPYVMAYDLSALSVVAAMMICAVNVQSPFSRSKKMIAFAVYILPLVHLVTEYLDVPIAVLFLVAFAGLMVARCVGFKPQDSESLDVNDESQKNDTQAWLSNKTPATSS